MTLQDFLNQRAALKKADTLTDEELLVALQRKLGIASQKLLAVVLDIPEPTISNVLLGKTKLTQMGRAYAFHFLHFFAPQLERPANQTVTYI